MKTKNRALALLLTLCMVLSMLPMGAFAAETDAAAELPLVLVEEPNPAAEPAGVRGETLGTDVIQVKDATHKYPTFAAAMTAITNDAGALIEGDVYNVTFLGDCTDTTSSTITKKVNIVGGGHKLTLAPTNIWAFITVSAETTITNLDIATTGINDVFHSSAKMTVKDCDFTVETPENGIFNMPSGSVDFQSGTATGTSTKSLLATVNPSTTLTVKTGTGAVTALTGAIRVNKNGFLTLAADSTALTDYHIVTGTGDFAASDKVIDCSAVPSIAATVAANTSVNGGKNTDWTAQQATNDVTLKRTNNNYVKFGATDGGNGTFAKPYNALSAAYTNTATDGEIRVLSDGTMAAATTFDADKTVTITSYTDASTPKTDGGWKLTRDAALTNDSALKVSKGTVSLSHITLDGNAQWDHADQLTTRTATHTTAHQLIQITGGELVLGDGATVQNHARIHEVPSGADMGSAIHLTGPGAKLTMQGTAQIINNSVTNAANDGNTGDGGAVSIWNGAVFTMNNGTISGNTAGRMGGAVRVSLTGSNKGQFVLNGGSITGNALIGTGASEGGGVSVSGGILKIASVKNDTPIVVKNNSLKDGTFSNVKASTNDLELGDMSGKISDIGITTAADTVFATSALNTDLPYFHADADGYQVVLEGDTLKLVAMPDAVYVADGTVGANTVPAGADTNAGTKEAPFLTLAHAYQRVKNGGRIYVMEDIDVPTTTFAVDKAVTIEGDNNTVRTLTRPSGDDPAVNTLNVNGGIITLKNIKITDAAGGTFTNAPVCIQTPGKLVMDTGSGITGTSSSYAAVYIFSGELEMKDGSAITGNTNKYATVDTGDGVNTALQGAGGGVCVSKSGKLSVQGNVKITGNTANGAASNVYLAADDNTLMTVTGNLAPGAKIGVSGVAGVMDEHGAFGTTTETAANVSTIIQDNPASKFPMAVRSSEKNKLVWAAADKNWLDMVASDANGYGWNDDAKDPDSINGGGVANNGYPNGIRIDTPAKLYSLTWAIGTNYNKIGASYADGYYYMTADVDLAQLSWTPIGTTAIPFTGVFEGDGMKTVTGITYQGTSALYGLFGCVGKTGGVTHVIPEGKGTASLDSALRGTMIRRVTVDGTGHTAWTRTSAAGDAYMGGIAARATDATIQNCAVTNLNLQNGAAGNGYTGGIVGEAEDCLLQNNSTGATGGAMNISTDANKAGCSAYTGGTVGKATNCTVSASSVGGSETSTNQTSILSVPADDTAPTYAGGVVGYAQGGTMRGMTWANINAIKVEAQNYAANGAAYAGGLAGYAADLTMIGCGYGANAAQNQIIIAQGYGAHVTGKNYAGGLVGVAERCAISDGALAANPATALTVTAGQGNENVAGGLVGVAKDCRILTSSVINVTVDASGEKGHAGGLAGYFNATKKADLGDKKAVGVMAQCYAVDATVTSDSGIHCPMIATAKNAYIISCYATAGTPEAVGVYAFADTTGSTLVGCYSTASSAAKLAFVATDAIFENCYCASGTGAVSATDATRINGDQTPIDPAKMQHDQDTALVAALGFALRGQADAAKYAAMTGLDMGYKAGSATNDAANNYKAPTFAKMFVLTVNTKPSSLYGTYTVTVGGTNLAGENATGLHQYVIAEGTGVVVAGIKNDNASAVTVTGGDTAGTINAIDKDTTVIVTFTPTVRYGWTMNQDITGKSAAGYGDITEKALTSSGSSLYGNTVAGWKKTEGAQPWAANAQHKIKTILVTGDGKFGSVINGYALPAGWVLTSGGTDKTYVQLTCELGATGAETAAVVNSVSFKGTADGTAAVRVYLDENVHGKLFAYGDSVYELSAVATNWGGAKALAENTALGGKNGHLVVIGTADEHAFLAEHVKTNAWTAAKVDVQGTNTTLTNWSWDVTGGAAITAEETAYLQNPSSWTAGEPNASGTNATYHYAGHFDDTNQNNLALIEYDTHGVAAVDWQGYSATAAGTVTVSAPYTPTNPTRPKKPVVPGEIVPADPHKNGVANILEADKHVVYLVGNDAGNFAPEAGITRAEVAQLFYNLLKNKDDAVGKIAYSDVAADAWYTKAVNALSNLGIMKGVGDGLFAPERNISRAEFTVIALRFADDIEGTVTFKDVPAEHWASSAISGAAQYGWIMGYTDGTFKPLGDIQRAEAAKIVNTMLGRSPDKTFIEKSENLKTFPDVARDHWAFYDIAEATNAHEFTKVKNVEKWSK